MNSERTTVGGRTEIGRGLLSDQIYEVVRDAILSGELSPGDRVVESEVARRYEVSQAPVREAVKRLAQEGLLTYLPRRGNFVSSISEDEMAEARVVRAAMESLAASLVGSRIAPSRVTQLREIVARMHTAVSDHSYDEFRRLDVSFHRTVIESTGNSVLLRVWDVLQPTFLATRVISDPFYQGERDVIASEHGYLVDLLEGTDVERAAAEFSRHAAGEPPRTALPS